MELLPDEILLKFQSFCAYQERCISEIRLKCVKMNLSQELQVKLIQELQDADFLNEKRFTESYVSGKFRIKKWGRRKIYAGLRAKGIDSILIADAMNEIDPDTYWETLVTMTERKYAELSVKKGNDWANRVALTRFLLQRGFENGLVNEAVDQIVKQ